MEALPDGERFAPGELLEVDASGAAELPALECGDEIAVRFTRAVQEPGAPAEREYNALNKPEKVTDPLGRETLLQYDAMWNLARVTGPNGARTTYLYNENNRLTRVKDALGNVTR